MYTTKTKMLFNQLPGMMVYDNDEEIWTRAVEWRGEPFRSLAGADNADYLKARAIGHIESFPRHLRTAFPTLEMADYSIDQPRDVEIRIFPRIFECLTCGRAKTWPDGASPPRTYSNGFYCQHCRRSSRFSQRNLVFVHHCGAIAAPLLPRCQTQGHAYEHLYLVNLGGQRAGDIEVRCMGDGTKSEPQCDQLNEPLLPDSRTHPRTGCPLARRLADEFTTDPDATRLVESLRDRGVQLRPAKDPLNYRAIGIDLVVPNVAVPPHLAASAGAVESLALSLIAGERLDGEALKETVDGASGESPRIVAIGNAIAAFESGTQGITAETVLGQMWTMVMQASRLQDPPVSPSEARAEIARLQGRSEAGASVLQVDRPDRRALADHLVEMTHILGPDAGFRGLTATASRLREAGRSFTQPFEQAAAQASQLGLDDIALSESFNIVRLQLGYTRGTYDRELAVLNPFTASGGDGRVKFYGRQSSTEAILFQVNPSRLVTWVHECFPNDEFIRLPINDLSSPEKCRAWLLQNCDFSSVEEFEPAQLMPTKAILEALHSMSHAFMRESTTFSGVEESNVKEMVFPGMPGFVVYKAQHGDFNLGGFVSLYEQHLHDWMTRAMARVLACQNDPLCRNGKMRDNILAAACYGCLTGSEHSCQMFNHNLDRAMLEETSRQREGPPFRGFWKWLQQNGHGA